MDTTLSIGELARRSGISIRALRLYEEQGLLQPLRTQAGRRVYGAADIGRLQHVLLLKKAGCTLTQIRRLLEQRRFDPVAMIDLQINAIEQQCQSLIQALATLRATRLRLTDGAVISVEALCDLIKLGEQTMTEEAWKPVLDHYYTAEDQQRWQAAKAEFTPGANEDYARAWSELIAQVEAAMACGVASDDPAAVKLALSWHALQKPLVEKLGLQTWNKAAKMYQEMDQWQTDTVKAPFSSEVYQYMSAASDAARAQGLLPPRAAAG